MSRLRDMNVANDVHTRVMRSGVMKSWICRTNEEAAGLEGSEAFRGEDSRFGPDSRYQRIETP